ncbi:MAG: hypothetical protein ACOYON_14655 [Fimbriimonas sp.]
MKRLLPLLFLLGGCASAPVKEVVRPPLLTANAISAFDSADPEPAILWNGGIGLRFPAYGTDGALWLASEVQPDGEEKLLVFPNPLLVRLTVEGRHYEPLSDFERTFDFGSGVLSSSYVASDGRVSYRVAVHPETRAVAQTMEVTLEHGEKGKAELLFPSGAQCIVPVFLFRVGDTLVRGTVEREKDGVWYPVTGTSMRFDDNGLRLRWSLQFDSMAPAPSGVARIGAPGPASPPISAESIFRAAKEYASDPKAPAIEIDGPVEDQAFVSSALYRLRTAYHAQKDLGRGPFGLSNRQYFGHVFWDSDLWVFPALALLDPDAARSIPAYRLKHLAQARRNFGAWLVDGRPVAVRDRKLGPLSARSGVLFPWESSVTGKETAPGAFRYAHHLTGSVAFAIEMASALGLVPEQAAREVREGAAGFYAARSTPGPNGREIRFVMTPDEQDQDNDLYTNLVAQWCQNGGQFEGPSKYWLPRKGETYLAFQDDPLKGYKQASALLAVYPLQFPPAEREAKQMLARFEPLTFAHGPAMTGAIHSIIYARLGEADRAYDLWQADWKRHTVGPHLHFSEKERVASTYFLTGAAGSLQAVLYGFAGIRVDTKPTPGATHQLFLKDGRVLSISPRLPKAWKGMRIRSLAVLGKRYDLVIRRQVDGKVLSTLTPMP